MIFWRKKNEEFEWREYVRTTILVRRQERRQKLHDAKDAAVFGVKSAGRSGWRMLIDGSIGAASSTASMAMWSAGALARSLATASGAAWIGLTAAASMAWSALALILGGIGQILGPVIGWTAEIIARVLEPLLVLLSGARVRRVLLVAGTLTGALAAGRSAFVAFDGEAQLAAGAAATALGSLALPVLFSIDFRSPLSALAERASDLAQSIADRMTWLSPRVITAAVLLGVGAAGAGYLLPDIDLKRPLETASIDQGEQRTFEGRMSAVSGDTLKAGSALFRLSGVEAPEPDQSCTRVDGRAWRCGVAAREAMSRILRGQRVSCTLTGEVSSQVRLATCSAGGRDVAEELVREGHIFATASIFSGYGSVETEAREARRGLWFGESLRPADYRAQRWEEAKRSSPDGCPIKGQVSGQERVYVLPWSAAYERAKVRPARGERWFCSEDEARAAGWRLSSQS